MLTRSLLSILCIYSLHSVAQTFPADKLLDSCFSFQGIERYKFFSAHLSKINDRHQDTVLYFAKRAEEFSEETRSLHAKGLSQYFYSNHYHSKSKMSKSLHAGLRAAKILEEVNDSINLARVYNELGVIYYNLSDHDESACYHRKSIELIDKEREPYLFYAYKLNMASVVSTFNNQESIRMFREVLESLDTTSLDLLSMAHNALAIRLNFTNQDDSTLYHSNKAIHYLKRIGNKDGLGLRYASLASFYYKKEDYQKAEEFIDKAIKLAEEMQYYPSLASRYFTKTYILTIQGKLKQAEVYLEKGRKIVMDNGLELYKESYYLEAARVAEAKGDCQEAFDFIVYWSELNDSLKEEQNNQFITALKTKYEVLEKEQQIEVLSKQNKIQQLETNQSRMLVFILIALLLFSLFFFWRKRKKDKLITEQKQQILKLKLEEKVLQENKLKQEVELKNQQLVTKTLKLTEKTKFLSELNTELDRLQKSLPDKEIKKTSRLSSLLHENSNIEKEWEEFRQYFDQVNPNFLPKLSQINPNLTNAEIRLALLINLRLDTKDCADILHISTQSVKTARHRLKKKLGLSSAQSLNDFLQQFS